MNIYNIYIYIHHIGLSRNSLHNRFENAHCFIFNILHWQSNVCFQHIFVFFKKHLQIFSPQSVGKPAPWYWLWPSKSPRGVRKTPKRFQKTPKNSEICVFKCYVLDFVLGTWAIDTCVFDFVGLGTSKTMSRKNPCKRNSFHTVFLLPFFCKKKV